jgi:hypothetical protein
MAGGCDLCDQRWASLHLLADHEESCTGVRAREGLEHGRGALRVRPVVERERDRRGFTADRAWNVQRGRGRCADRSEGMADHARMIAV